MKKITLPTKKEIKRKYYATKRAIIYRFRKSQLDFEFEVKKQIQIFLRKNNILDTVQVQEIRVKKRKDHVRIYMSAYKPGLLIGKQGSTIKELEVVLSDFCFKKAIVSIKSFDIWKPYLQTYA